jgi:hypothetical protein
MIHGLNLNKSPIVVESDSRVFRNWLLHGAGPFVGFTSPRRSDFYPTYIDGTTGIAEMTTGTAIILPDVTILTLSFRGTGAVQLVGWVAGNPYNLLDNRPGNAEGHAQGQASKDVAFLLAQSQGIMRVQILASDVNDPVHDISVGLKSDGDQTFTQDFLDNIGRFAGPIRFMDWQDTNSPDEGKCNFWRNWGDQDTMKPGMTPYERGYIPYNYWWELCNAAGRDMWVNTPAFAGEDYCKQMGAYFATHLEPGLKIYVEHSNETWNFAFYQYQHQLDEHDNGNDPDPNKPATGAWEYISYRCGRATNWFREGALAADPGREVVCVLAEQAGYYATLEIAITNWGLGGFPIDAIAMAPYVGISEAFEPVRQEVGALYDTGTGAEKAANEVAALDHLMNDLLGPGLANSLSWVDYWANRKATVPNRAGGQGVPLLIYEVNETAVEPFNDVVTNLYVAAGSDPRMYDLLTALIDGIKDKVDICEWFFDVGRDSKYGKWGLQRYTGEPLETANKQRAVLNAIGGVVGGLSAGSLSASVTSATSVRLTWTAPHGGTSPYSAQLYRDGVAVSGATTSPYDDTGRTTGQAYIYKVRYTDSAGTPATAESATRTVTPSAGGGPLAAGTLSGSSSTSTTADLSWTGPSGGTSPYTSQLKRDGVSVSGATSSPYTDTGLTTGQAYAYTVAFADAASGTATSNTATVTPSAPSPGVTGTVVARRLRVGRRWRVPG